MRLLAQDKAQGLEVWVSFDATASVYELFAGPSSARFIGCADSLPHARWMAEEWLAAKARDPK